MGEKNSSILSCLMWDESPNGCHVSIIHISLSVLEIFSRDTDNKPVYN